jgi:hypothetical protein
MINLLESSGSSHKPSIFPEYSISGVYLIISSRSWSAPVSESGEYLTELKGFQGQARKNYLMNTVRRLSKMITAK